MQVSRPGRPWALVVLENHRCQTLTKRSIQYINVARVHSALTSKLSVWLEFDGRGLSKQLSPRSGQSSSLGSIMISNWDLSYRLLGKALATVFQVFQLFLISIRTLSSLFKSNCVIRSLLLF